jgi:extracellular elastinolytic metalloproteinase
LRAGSPAAHLRRLNRVPLAPGSTAGVRYLRFTMLSTQVPGDVAKNCADFLYPGCSEMQVTEVKVYGDPS